MLERVKSLSRQLDELEVEKQRIIEEIEDLIEFANPDDITQKLIDFYYWDTDFRITPLKTALAIKGNIKIQSQRECNFPCVGCGKPQTYIVGSKNSFKELRGAHRLASRSGGISFDFPNPKYSQFLCPDCVEKHKKSLVEVKEEIDKQKAKYPNSADFSYEELVSMPYLMYLQTKHWRSFANFAKIHAEFKCEECGVTNATLDVHHLSYVHRGRETLEDVKVLCRHCHDRIHNK